MQPGCFTSSESRSVYHSEWLSIHRILAILLVTKLWVLSTTKLGARIAQFVD
jgi:hypothetical protein